MKRAHEDLQVWQLSMQLVKDIYAMIRHFPDTERFGLSSQMQRAAVSIPSNIAEGAARSGNQEFLQFLHIARGSLCELETQVTIAYELKFGSNHQAILKQINEIFAKLSGFIHSVKKKAMK